MADERKFIGIEPQQTRNVGGAETKVKGQTKNSVAETIEQVSQLVVEQPAPVIEATTVKQNQTNTQIVNPELPPEVSVDVEETKAEIIDISPDLSIQVELPQTDIKEEFTGISTSDLSKFVRYDNLPKPDPRLKTEIEIKKSPLDEQGGALAQIKESIEIKKTKSADKFEIEESREKALDTIKIGTFSNPIESQVVKYPTEPKPLGIYVEDMTEVSQVTTVIGPKGVVLEEFGPDGKLVNDPIKDAGFDPLDPPDGVKALREEFKQYVESGQDEASTFDASLGFQSSEETNDLLRKDGLENLIAVNTTTQEIETESGVGSSTTARENVTTAKDVAEKLKARDYRATIVEVLDSNRIRVSLSYNDGVNLVKHVGEDDISKKFPNWKVVYRKNNLERFKTYMVKDDQYCLVINDVLGVDGKSRIVKTKQPLRDNVSLLDRLYFVEKRLPDYTDTIRLEPFVEQEKEGIYMRLPKFESELAYNPTLEFQGTNYKNRNDLVSDITDDTNRIEQKVLSQSLLDVQPNIDYQKRTTEFDEVDDTGFGNFVNFSSAERRVSNFREKLRLIESHSAASASLLTVTSSLSQIQFLEKKRQRVKNSFDPFEHYMYYESSSYVTSSEGQFHDTSWPKSTSTSPYTLYSVTSSQATSWYSNMIKSASTYDQNNMDSLRNSLPGHVSNDDSNNVFLEFMDMVGQQFDEVWTYVKSITDINKRVENLSEGISKDVAREYAKSLGLDFYSGNNLLNLPEYLLGKNQDGTDLYESPQEAVTEEIWKRILANLPFFVKTKGTERAVKGLLSCYGIPSSILRVREYGGPDKGTRVSYEIKRKFTRATDFKAGQYIKSNWKTTAGTSRYPETIEFRFRSPHSVGTSGSMAILQKGSEWGISLQDNGSTDDYGHLKFTISGSKGTQYITSSLLPFYNDEMWSVMLTRKAGANRTDGASLGGRLPSDTTKSQSVYELTTKQYDATRNTILFEDSQSLTSHTASAVADPNNVSGSQLNAAFTSSGFVFLGGSGSRFGTQFSGSLMEYRLWSEPLSASVFDNHVRTPKAYNGNSYSSSYDNLFVRYELNDNKNLQTFPTLSNVAHIQTYETGSIGASINGFTGNFSRTLVDKEQLRVPNVGPNRRNATKIRIEDTTITQPLLPDNRKEKSSQDFAPIDSNKVGVYFSPTDVVNEDIVYSIADFNFDDYIGDPRDEFKVQYKDLRDLRDEYFKRYTSSNNFWDYLKILSHYDASIFKQLKSLLPARADSQTGVLIEPNILERSKQIIGDKPEFDNRYYENANIFEDGIQVTRFISGSPDNIVQTFGSYDTYNGGVNLNDFSSGSDALGVLGVPSLVHLDKLNPKQEFGTLYATASVEVGGINDHFTQALQTNVSHSRLAEHNEERNYFFTSEGNALRVSGSYQYSASRVQSMAHDTRLFRAFYQGTILSRNNTIDGKDPVEVTIVAPTTLKTQDAEQTKLKVE